MGGLGLFQSGLHTRQHRGVVGIDLLCPEGVVGGVDQPGHRHLHEAGVAHVLRPVGEDPLLDLRHQVDVLGGVERHAGEQGGGVLLHLQHLHQGHAAGAGGRGGDGLEASPVHHQRIAPHRPVTGQVRPGDPALHLAPGHLRHQQVCGPAAIELVRPVPRDPGEGGGQLRLAKDPARLQTAEIAAEVGGVLEGGHILPVQLGDQGLVDHEPAAGEADGRGQVPRPGQAGEAVMQLVHAPHRARHAGGQVAHQAEVRDHVARLVQIHVRTGRRGRRLAIVEEVGLALEPHGGKAAAAEVSGLRIGHGLDEGEGHGGVHRIAAGLQDLGRSPGPVDVGGGHRRGVEGSGRSGRGGLGAPGTRSTGVSCGHQGQRSQDRARESGGNLQAHICLAPSVPARREPSRNAVRPSATRPVGELPASAAPNPLQNCHTPPPTGGLRANLAPILSESRPLVVKMSFRKCLTAR